MAGQGRVTKLIANKLVDHDWKVLFTCIPNTPHINVVPIQIVGGSSKQRYPDIAALRENTIGLLEVEIQLSQSVANDIMVRFQEMIDALRNPDQYRQWANTVTRVTGYTLPSSPVFSTVLIVCKNFGIFDNHLIRTLSNKNISVSYFESFL